MPKIRKKSKSRNVYLGKRVRDVNGPGLTNSSEVRGIMRAILRDRKSGKINSRKARGRLLLLYLLVKKKKIKPTKTLMAEIRSAMKKV